MSKDNIGGINKITVIGLGLIGGSLAKAIKRAYPNIEIIGVDNNQKSTYKACFDGILNYGINNYEDLNVSKKIGESDIIFLCVDINTCGRIIDSIGGCIKKGAVVSDVCSTKKKIKALFDKKAADYFYIGGHPMTGSEKSGYEASSEYLFENAMYILSPMENTPQELVEMMSGFIKGLGAIPFVLSAEKHDMYIARISHLPHVAAAALVNTALICETEDGTLRSLAAGGFRDITRIASGDPNLWESIIMSNSENVCTCIDELIKSLSDCKKYILDGGEGLVSYFAQARDYRERFETGPRAVMKLMYELDVDVVDKPGVIADVSQKLSEAGINIKNIYIAESRENEGGCLRIAFETPEDKRKAAEILC